MCSCLRSTGEVQYIKIALFTLRNARKAPEENEVALAKKNGKLVHVACVIIGNLFSFIPSFMFVVMFVLLYFLSDFHVCLSIFVYGFVYLWICFFVEFACSFMYICVCLFIYPLKFSIYLFTYLSSYWFMFKSTNSSTQMSLYITLHHHTFIIDLSSCLLIHLSPKSDPVNKVSYFNTYFPDSVQTSSLHLPIYHFIY